MTTDGASSAKPANHRDPTQATVKQLYGTALRCAEPPCGEPLYREVPATGTQVLNSRVCHIHARSEGGPRWDPDMDEEANRGYDNLVLMCLRHASQIDIFPRPVPA